ncbi:MAG: hypothetical protein E6X17_07720 [Sporomusaceae bacterium]|nr:hypothetical protein [Sporomusaceae bacterium]
MKNVYEAVQVFFEEELTEQSIIAQEWIERFLRRKAWSGLTDKQLQQLWKEIQALQIYLSYTHYQSLDELTAEDYADAVLWLDLNSSEFRANLKSVRHFFAVLDEFYRYLAGRGLIADLSALQSATRQIVGGKRLNLSISRVADAYRPLDRSEGEDDSPMLPAEEALPEVLEKVMLKMGSYFQREEYDAEFHRALYLYVGPLQSLPVFEDSQFSEFWIGFWDYFLFDYHLRADDLSPVTHYLRSKSRLSEPEKVVLRQLSQARYKVFFIQRIIDAEWVECVDLFTEASFRLPYPEFDNRMMKRLLFFGHVFDDGSFATNYIASIEISTNLRRRVRQEVVRLKELFSIQKPGASWDEFIGRHCLAVRHTITLLTSFAKLNVTAQLPLPAAAPMAKDAAADPRVTEQLGRLMPKYGFSVYDISLAQAMWRDFSGVSSVKPRKSGSWAAAVISCYAMLNSPLTMPVETLAAESGVSAATVYGNRRRLAAALGLVRHDPRYLSEEGFLLLLYSS